MFVKFAVVALVASVACGQHLSGLGGGLGGLSSGHNGLGGLSGGHNGLGGISSGHGHGAAYSSQSIVRHDSHQQQQYHHAAPLVHHVAPIVHHVAPVLHHVAPVIHAAPIHHEEQHHDNYAHPKYEYAYEVKDTHTGDIKSQHESRDGDVVKGVYSLHEADGTIRTVHYSADKHSGFNAHVERSGHAQHVQPQYHH